MSFYDLNLILLQNKGGWSVVVSFLSDISFDFDSYVYSICLFKFRILHSLRFQPAVLTWVSYLWKWWFNCKTVSYELLMCSWCNMWNIIIFCGFLRYACGIFSLDHSLTLARLEIRCFRCHELILNLNSHFDSFFKSSLMNLTFNNTRFLWELLPWLTRYLLT